MESRAANGLLRKKKFLKVAQAFAEVQANRRSVERRPAMRLLLDLGFLLDVALVLSFHGRIGGDMIGHGVGGGECGLEPL